MGYRRIFKGRVVFLGFIGYTHLRSYRGARILSLLLIRIVIIFMNRKILSLSTATLTIAPLIAGAQALPGSKLVQDTGSITTMVLGFVNGVVMPALFAVIFLYFAWAMFQTFIKGAQNEEERAKGKSAAINAIIGTVLIVSFWGLVNFFAGGFGLTDTGLQNVPRVPNVGQ